MASRSWKSATSALLVLCAAVTLLAPVPASARSAVAAGMRRGTAAGLAQRQMWNSLSPRQQELFEAVENAEALSLVTQGHLIPPTPECAAEVARAIGAEDEEVEFVGASLNYFLMHTRGQSLAMAFLSPRKTSMLGQLNAVMWNYQRQYGRVPVINEQTVMQAAELVGASQEEIPAVCVILGQVTNFASTINSIQREIQSIRR